MRHRENRPKAMPPTIAAMGIAMPAMETRVLDPHILELLRLWKPFERFDDRGSLSSWIYSVIRNRCLTALQRRRTFESLDEWDASAAGIIEPRDGRAEQLLSLVELLPEGLRPALLLMQPALA